MSIQNKLRSFGAGLSRLLTGGCSHYWKPMTGTRYIIWEETGESNSFHSGNQKSEMFMTVNVELFTQEEYDDLVDDICEFFNENYSRWQLDRVAYEDETNMIHWSWTVEVSVA